MRRALRRIVVTSTRTHSQRRSSSIFQRLPTHESPSYRLPDSLARYCSSSATDAFTLKWRTTKPSSVCAARSFSSFASSSSPALLQNSHESESVYDQTWNRIKHDILHNIPVGNMRDVDWMQALELLKTLRSHTHGGWDQQQTAASVADCFRILDRFALECQAIAQKNQQQQEQEKQVLQPEYMTPSPERFPLDVRLLGSTLTAWKRLFRTTQGRAQSSINFPWAGHEILQKVHFYRQVGLFEPNVVTYNTLLDHLDQVVDNPAQASQLGHAIWVRMLNESQGNPFYEPSHPNQSTVLHLLNIWIQNRNHDCAERAEALVDNLTEWYHETRRPDLRVTLKIYAALAKAHEIDADHSNNNNNNGSDSNNSAVQSTQRLLNVAQRAWDACLSGEVEMNVLALNRILHALGRTRNPRAAEMAAEILDKLMDAAQHSGQSTWKPNESTFLAVITALGRTGQAERAAAVLRQMEDLYDSTCDPSFLPTKECYGALIWGYVKIGDSQKAEETLLRMSGKCELESDSWNGVLASWVQSGEQGAAERISKVIEWLQESDEASSSLQVSTFNSLMGGYARTEDPQHGALLATNLFRWMQEHENPKVHPNAITYLALITAWRNANNPEKAENVLRMASQRMKKDKTVKFLDERHFNICISAWGESDHPQAADRSDALFKEMEAMHIAPDIVTYNCLIKVHSKLESPFRAAKECLSLIRTAHEKARAGKIANFPDLISFNTTIAALGRSNNEFFMKEAMKLFMEMEKRGIRRNAATYTTVMAIYSRLGEPEKVESILLGMRAAADAGNTSYAPTFRSYTTLLQAWARAGDPKETFRVLEEMIELYENGNLEKKPVTRDFNALLQAWLLSNRPDAPESALTAIETMKTIAATKRLDCVPDTISYNMVISILAKSGQSKDALRILREMEAIGSGMSRPDITSYCQVLVSLAVDASSGSHEIMNGILDEINGKPSAFWTQKNTQKELRRVCDSLLASGLENKEKILRRVVGMLKQRGIRVGGHILDLLGNNNAPR